MSSCAGAPKRRRRLVGGTEEDAPGGEEEDQEGQEKLPLESEALLRQLIHQQRSSLHQYRREIACLQRQFEEQRREAAVAAQRREAVVTTWGELQSDVLLLKTRLASHVDPSLVRKLLDCPESSLLAPSIFATKAPAKSEGSEEAGEEPAACDATDGAASPALSFEAPLSSDSEDSEEESSSNSKGSPSAEQEKKRLDEELRRQREWTVELLRDFVAAVEARAGPEAGHEEKPDKTEMESSNGVACAMSEKVFFDRMRGALHKLREAARRHRRRARALERDLRAQKKETLALKVETDRLQKQQALLKYRFRVLSGASPESAASLLRAAGLRDEALEETPGARAETGVSPETPSGADGGPSAAQPGASGPQVGAPNGPEAARADAGSRLSPGEPAPEKGDTGGDSAVGRVGSGEGSFDFLPPTTAPEEILEHLESLQRKLREREKEITRLQEERAKAEKLTAEVKILRTLNHELILQSSPYVELQQQAAKLEEAVVVRTAEVDELRRELLHEQKHKDEEFEKLLTETKEQTERLLEKMKTLTDELQSACIDREKALFEGERLRQELLHRKASQEEQETVFAQRCVQLSKLKMQHEQLKNAGTQMLLRNERMRKERQTLIEAIRQKDELICRLKLRLRAEERQKQEGVAAGNAASAHEISSSSTPSPTAEKVEPATDPTQNCVSGVAGTSAASPSSSPRDVPRDSLHGSALLSLDALELPGLEGDAETVEVQMAKMKLDKDALQRRLADYDQLVVEIAGLREQYARVSEEVEEVSKAFEERQTFCEHLLKQVKEKDEALADLRNRNASFLQQQQMLSRLSRLHDQKLLLLRQQYEQTTTNSRVYADALQQANVRVTLADQQREEATSIYQQMRTARDTLYKEAEKIQDLLFDLTPQKEEALAKLNTVVEANKVLDAAAQESLARRNSAENEARALVDAKVELEKRIDKLKAKEEKQDRKRAHTAALEELSVRDLQLLKDENETMRRRLVCFVCNERFKDHMINKCGHMFCQVCLERNVKTRNRKCPHCKAQFDQKDIRKVYLDN